MVDTLMASLPNAPETVKLDTVPPDPLNSDVDWDTFDPEAYRNHNYLTLRDDDHQIMVKIRDFFAAAEVTNARGVDVGAGANLYPSLAMLPFCRTLDLREFSAPNVAWLARQIERFDDKWDAFWSVYQENPAYALMGDPRGRLAQIASVRQFDLFKLPERRWELGTMFFVACSLSSDIQEFHRATHRFVRSLKPGSPFAAAFMEGSDGYPVGDARFPAVGIRAQDVAESLASVAYDDVVITRITSGDDPLRDGYSGGMILAMGRAAG
jgi:NNMT/PNMT/TEMT family